jgi:chromatin segregation and condensation protein Rec8/ScpA/Scc1 (kleisin family)
MLRALSERRRNSTHTAKLHMITVEETIRKLAQDLESINFMLFQGMYNVFQTRYEFVVHILAMLELVKEKRVKLQQEEHFGPIWMYRFDCDESVLPGHGRHGSEEAALVLPPDAQIEIPETPEIFREAASD